MLDERQADAQVLDECGDARPVEDGHGRTDLVTVSRVAGQDLAKRCRGRLGEQSKLLPCLPYAISEILFTLGYSFAPISFAFSDVQI